MKNIKAICMTIALLLTMTACENRREVEEAPVAGAVVHTDKFENGKYRYEPNNNEIEDTTEQKEDTVEDNEQGNDNGFNPYILFETGEDKQEHTKLTEKGAIDDSENNKGMFEYVIKDSTTDIESIPEEMREIIIFSYMTEREAMACYDAAVEYLGEVDTMVLSEWSTTTIYTDAYCMVFLINGERYKFIIKLDGSKLYITTEI